LQSADRHHPVVIGALARRQLSPRHGSPLPLAVPLRHLLGRHAHEELHFGFIVGHVGVSCKSLHVRLVGQARQLPSLRGPEDLGANRGLLRLQLCRSRQFFRRQAGNERLTLLRLFRRSLRCGLGDLRLVPFKFLQPPPLPLLPVLVLELLLLHIQLLVLQALRLEKLLLRRLLIALCGNGKVIGGSTAL
jgi:hypothetical protein